MLQNNKHKITNFYGINYFWQSCCLASMLSSLITVYPQTRIIHQRYWWKHRDDNLLAFLGSCVRTVCCVTPASSVWYAGVSQPAQPIQCLPFRNQPVGTLSFRVGWWIKTSRKREKSQDGTELNFSKNDRCNLNSSVYLNTSLHSSLGQDITH